MNKDPANMDEYKKKFELNTTYSGQGLDTTIHVPCPYCAEPEFMVYKIVESETALKKGGFCKHCQRGMVTVFHVDTPNNKQFEMVQTVGPDAPDYLPKIRRKTEG